MLYKRGKTWWIRFTTPSGERVRRSAGTTIKHEAQELHDNLKTTYWRQKTLNEQPKRSWQEAVVRWLHETSHKKTHDNDKAQLRWIDQHLHHCMLTDVNRDLIDHMTRVRLEDGVKNATVNRMLEIVRAILRKAEREWEWLDKAPYVRMLKEPKRRIRWLTYKEAELLLTCLPKHLVAPVTFSLATGLRKSNVTGLTWQQVDLERRVAWIYADEAKGGRSIHVPLNDDAVEVLHSLIGNHETSVFTYRGNPIKQVNTKAWKKALVKANIYNFRWHDLRHTWASWHVQNGTPLAVLQELGGWESADMVRRYAHLGNEHLAQYANSSTFRSGTNLAQSTGG